jgi:DNA-directed RNA polymerase subunit K/omega
MFMVSKYQKARLLSARALQIARGAKPLVQTKQKSAVEIAEEELAILW